MEFGPDTVREGALCLGQALLAGVAMGVYYDAFRILRRIFHFDYATICVQDIFFFVTSAIGLFFACIHFTGGTMRISLAVAALAGWGAYAATLGALLMSVIDRLAALAGQILRRMRLGNAGCADNAKNMARKLKK